MYGSIENLNQIRFKAAKKVAARDGVALLSPSLD